ncbi:MAG: hypothetical protein J2P16_07090 [Mycobacterium sp.]|nr:hypothetical protein [Mycobacterium sp.]
MSTVADAFQRVVGVTVDEWVAADTPEKFQDLLHRRDHPPMCTVEHTYLLVVDWTGSPVEEIRNEPCNGIHPE